VNLPAGAVAAIKQPVIAATALMCLIVSSQSVDPGELDDLKRGAETRVVLFNPVSHEPIVRDSGDVFVPLLARGCGICL
jgi:hypothetical protein